MFSRRIITSNALSRGKRLLCSSKVLSKALKVAFFGSDEFSTESLRQLIEASRHDKDLVSHIDLIAKHPKATGRDLKTITDVPISKFAEKEGINIIRAETSKEINDIIPNKYDMAIAVSYGKLIPENFLAAVPYSLNVHPSLLPKYSGASPLQFALLNHDTHTGVTVQTLHPTVFDKGEIVAQTPEIEIAKNETLISLRDRLAVEGAKLLARVVRERSYINPNFSSKYEFSYASKITPMMSEIDWTRSAYEIMRQYRTLGSLHTYKEIRIKRRRKPLIREWRRVILSDLVEVDDIHDLRPGEFKLTGDVLTVKTASGSIGAKSVQLEFEKREDPAKFMRSLTKRAGETPAVFETKR